MTFDRRSLILPAGTTFEEHTIVTPGDVVVADRCDVEFGLRTEERVYVGEGARIGGDVVAGGEVRVDHLSSVEDDVTCETYCYLGEGVSIDGKLSVDGDLDVGDDVEIASGFEAHGWINIRGPIPLVVYVFIYLMELLRQGRSAEVERILEELDRDDERIHVGEVFLFVPPGTELGLQESRIAGNLSIGPDCRLVGNFDVDGNVHVGEGAEVFGAVRADGRCTVEPDATIEGDLTCDGEVHLDAGTHVHGALVGRRVEMDQSAVVGGTVQADDGITFVTPGVKEMQEKVERFEDDAPERVEELLE